MKSFLGYVVACDFTEKELHHFRTALKFFQNTLQYSYSRYSVTLVEKSHS